MNENVELLEFIYKTAEMGSFTLTKLINELKDKENKIKKVVEDEIKGYEKYIKESTQSVIQSLPRHPSRKYQTRLQLREDKVNRLPCRCGWFHVPFSSEVYR